MISCHVKCYDMQLFQAEDDVVGQKTVIYVRFSLLSNNNHCVSWIASLKITIVYIDRRETNEYSCYELKIFQTKDFECVSLLYWLHYTNHIFALVSLGRVTRSDSTSSSTLFSTHSQPLILPC